MKVLKETLDAFSRFGREWLQKLWMPYALLAAMAGVFMALMLKSCVSTFFPLIEWWRMIGDWAIAMEMVNADVLWTTLAALSFIALVGISWFAHVAMTRVLRVYPARELRGRRKVLHLLMSACFMLVVIAVTWMPVLTLILSADAAAVSEVWSDAVTTPVWVWLCAFLFTALATFICEWAMTICRLTFAVLPALEAAAEK